MIRIDLRSWWWDWVYRVLFASSTTSTIVAIRTTQIKELRTLVVLKRTWPLKINIKTDTYIAYITTLFTIVKMKINVCKINQFDYHDIWNFLSIFNKVTKIFMHYKNKQSMNVWHYASHGNKIIEKEEKALICFSTHIHLILLNANAYLIIFATFQQIYTCTCHQN